MTNISDLQLKPCSFGGQDEPQQAAAVASEIASCGIQHGVWESGPGELELHFQWHETVYVLDGRAEVENLTSGERFALTPGTMVSFESGSRWRWRIPWKLKKVFTIVEGPA